MGGEWATQCDPWILNQQLTFILPSHYCQSGRRLPPCNEFPFENVGINVEKQWNVVIIDDTTVCFSWRENPKIHHLYGFRHHPKNSFKDLSGFGNLINVH